MPKVAPTMETLGIKIDSKTKRRLGKIARETDRSISAVTRIAIEKGLLFFAKGGPHQDKKNLGRVAPTVER